MIMQYIKKNRENQQNQRGAVMIFVAAAMTAFIGFAALAIDVGFLMAARNELQNAADSAALAGASQLARGKNDNTIKQASINAAGLNKASNNNINLSNGDIELGKWNWDSDSVDAFINGATPFDAVKAKIENHHVELFFISDRGLGATAVAIVGPISGMRGLIPIAVTEEEIEDIIEAGEGIIYEIGRSAGNWGTVDFDSPETPGGPGGGNPEIGGWLENGYDGNINIGDDIYTETGVGKIVGGGNYAKVEDLIGEILVIPVIDQFGNGMSISEVRGFVAIEITKISGKGANTKISVKYHGKAIVGGNVDLGAQNFGVLGVKLVK
jgi:hypothetical protein